MKSRLSLSLAILMLPAALGCGDGWSVVHQELPGALISVWGTSATDVWSVGGDPGDGTGPFVLRYDGKQWRRLATGASGDLWWVHGFAGGPVFMSGKDGLILKYENGAFEKMATPGNGTVFGIWGPSADDLWAVGGDGDRAGFAWRYDGTAWRKLDVPPALSEVSIFKVWGGGQQDVWVVGSKGLAAKWNGTGFTQVDSGTTRTLFTCHTAGGKAAAVGGFGSGVVLEHDGDHWSDVTPSSAPQMIGVALTEKGGWAVGVNGEVLERTAKGWEKEETGLDVVSTLHAVWVDPEGGVWAAGGQVLAFPLIKGVLLHRGKAVTSGRYVE